MNDALLSGSLHVASGGMAPISDPVGSHARQRSTSRRRGAFVDADVSRQPTIPN